MLHLSVVAVLPVRANILSVALQLALVKSPANETFLLCIVLPTHPSYKTAVAGSFSSFIFLAG